MRGGGNGTPSNRRTCEKCGKTKGVQAFLKGQGVCRKCSGKFRSNRNVIASVPTVRQQDEPRDDLVHAESNGPEEIPGKPGLFRCARCATAKLRNAFPKRGEAGSEICYACHREEMAA